MILIEDLSGLQSTGYIFNVCIHVCSNIFLYFWGFFYGLVFIEEVIISRSLCSYVRNSVGGNALQVTRVT